MYQFSSIFGWELMGWVFSQLFAGEEWGRCQSPNNPSSKEMQLLAVRSQETEMLRPEGETLRTSGTMLNPAHVLKMTTSSLLR